MAEIKHKWHGEGTIIHRDGANITVRFDKNGMEMRLIIPDSFKNGFFTVEGELKNEVDAAIEAQEEGAKADAKAKAAAVVAMANAPAAKKTSTGARRSSKTPAKIAADHPLKTDYEQFLKESDYTEYTEQGDKSTVYQYSRAVEKILEDEGITWTDLPREIATLVQIYSKGGAKEHIGEKQNKTYINALRRFEDMINAIKP